MLGLNWKVLYAAMALVVMLGCDSAHAWFFGPSNYDECLVEYSKDTESNRAVTIIAYACKHKFKENIMQAYAECIFDYVPGVVSDRAATIVSYACKYKHIENKRIKYANCILDEVPGVKTDRAASVVSYSCGDRYP